MATISRLTKKSNIILLAVMLCCMGGCFTLLTVDVNKNHEMEDEVRNLPRLSSEEDIVKALDSPVTYMYLFVNYKFPRLEYITDPAGNFSDKYIYLQYTKSKWHDKVVRKGKVKKQAGWTTEAYKHYYGTLFMTKDVRLEGFDDARVEGCSGDTVHTDRYKHKYLYIRVGEPCTFVAELGHHCARLGFNDNRVLVKGDVETLLSAMSKEASHSVTCFFLLLAVIGIAVCVIRDVVKH